MYIYRIARIIQRRKLSQIRGKWDFTEKTFVACSFVLPTVYQLISNNLRENLSCMIGIKTAEFAKVSTSKDPTIQ